MLVIVWRFGVNQKVLFVLRPFDLDRARLGTGPLAAKKFAPDGTKVARER
jgi:hypothetical protein